MIGLSPQAPALQWPSCHKVCCAWINTIRDVYIDDHFTCVMIGFPPPVWRLQMCSLALWLPSHCKKGLHETLDSALGNYFKWTSYLCLQSVTPQAPDLERQQWQERTRVSASDGLLNLYLVTLLKQKTIMLLCFVVKISQKLHCRYYLNLIE